MGSERLEVIQLNADQFFRFVGVFLAAVVAAYVQPGAKGGRRKECVGFGEWDLVREKKVLMLMELMVPAKYSPIVLTLTHGLPRPGRNTD
jgi:hypothetical protein